MEGKFLYGDRWVSLEEFDALPSPIPPPTPISALHWVELPVRFGELQLKTGFLLYRAWSAEESLLYVGKTLNFPFRYSTHRRNAHWFSLVSRFSIQAYASAKALERAERFSIIREKPEYNIMYTDDLGGRRCTANTTSYNAYLEDPVNDPRRCGLSNGGDPSGLCQVHRKKLPPASR